MHPSAEKLRDEIKVFPHLWQGGFWASDPLIPVARSNLKAIGFISVPHAVYLTCIKPYVTAETCALEIGPGRGAYTRALLGAKEVWCLDARSAEANAFWAYVGEAPHVRYFQVEDFSCDMLPENHFDYFFSYDVFCHISFAGTTEYMRNLRAKLKPGAHCFVMVADFDKYNRAIDEFEKYSIYSELFPRAKWARPFRRLLEKAVRKSHCFERQIKSDGIAGTPGGWCHAGTDRTCAMLQDLGYRIIDRDLGVSPRDPVIHFTWPGH
jgi:hypothetical protein